ncbi:MAG: PHP domain-containing protein [Treponema sp.]|jgi:predicted metal-dependent phosphoesterase TrpH|nr:PHP domain-containing protein [Treponema sp.]
MIDLHTHSAASDGDLTPVQLVEFAVQRGLSAFALTDHDTIAGLLDAETAAKRRGIRFIPGVELEIQTESFDGDEVYTKIPPVKGEFHLLGLNITKILPEFTAELAYLKAAREKRNLLILEKMREAGIEASYEEIAACAGGGIIGRPHFGAYLIKRRVVRSIKQAFDRYLGKGRPFYAPRAGVEFSRALELIHRAGGRAVLAHPMSLYLSWGRLPDYIACLAVNGLDGIEAWHPTAIPNACRRLESLGRDLGLGISAGSDFHGSARPERRLGISSGGRKIGDEFLAVIDS